MQAANLRALGLVALFCYVSLMTAPAAVRTWNTTTGDWSEAANWTAAVPVAGDKVVITNRGALVLLTNSTAWLGSLVISNATLSCSNWNTTIYVTNLTILNSGILACAGPFSNNVMSNRVSLNCTNLFIEANGAINVNGRGYMGGRRGPVYTIGSGPGGGDYMNGAGYGGAGMHGEAPAYRLTNTYGSATAPLDPGSGGWSGTSDGKSGGDGGGAVCITAVQVVVNGSISANATLPSASGTHASGGSGGGIYIVCDTITGTNGAITANGSTSYTSSGGAGGGRIAVWYNVTSQNNLPKTPTILFQAAPSLSENKTAGDIGTLYFPDSALFSPTNLFTGQWVGPGLTNALFLSEWMVSNVWLRMPGFDLTVTNTLTVAGTNSLLHRLEFTNGSVINCGNLLISGSTFGMGGQGDTSKTFAVSQPTVVSSTMGPTLNCANNLILTNNSRFYVYAGLTNIGAEAGYGARITVGNEICIMTNCWIYPAAHSTNGVVPLFRARTVSIYSNAGFNASQLGYGGGLLGILPYGPGTGTSGFGSSYGGIGTKGYSGGGPGSTYGFSNAPVAPGSGARYGNSGTPTDNKAPDGGGSVQLRVSDTVTILGAIFANGNRGSLNYNGGSSGGSIYITCRTFIGNANGVLQANGGSGHYYGTPPVGSGGGGGGGGRIAVWRVFDKSTTIISNYVNGGLGYNAETGGVGTIVWGWTVPPNGCIVSVY